MLQYQVTHLTWLDLWQNLGTVNTKCTFLGQVCFRSILGSLALAMGILAWTVAWLNLPEMPPKDTRKVRIAMGVSTSPISCSLFIYRKHKLVVWNRLFIMYSLWKEIFFIRSLWRVIMSSRWNNCQSTIMVDRAMDLSFTRQNYLIFPKKL